MAVPHGVAKVVWQSLVLSDYDHRGWLTFLRQPDLDVAGGEVVLTIPVNTVVTVTNQMTKGHKRF